jgi:uncharacterized membrane protein YkvA (DUF1232 family)
MKISLQSVYQWYRDAIRNSKYRWWIVVGTLVYLLSPLDISPDFLPFVGQIDDIFLATILVTEVSQLMLERFKSAKKPSASTPEETKGETINVEAVSVK